MTRQENSIFAAGQSAGTHVAACVARLAAIELLEGSRWWNRWRRRLLARALIAYAEEMESAADVPEPDPRDARPRLAAATA